MYILKRSKMPADKSWRKQVAVLFFPTNAAEFTYEDRVADMTTEIDPNHDYKDEGVGDV